MSDKYRMPEAMPRSIPTSCIIVNIPSLFCASNMPRNCMYSQQSIITYSYAWTVHYHCLVSILLLASYHS